MNKNQLKAHLRVLQEERVGKMAEAVSAYNHAKDLDESDTLDSEDYSHQSESGDLAMQLERQLNLEKNQLEALKIISTESNATADLGAVLQLDDMWIYVSVSASAFEFDGHKIQPISVLAPIFAQMRGKKVNDEVQTKNGNKVIRSVI